MNTMTANDRRFYTDFMGMIAKNAENAIDAVYASIGYASDEQIEAAIVYAADTFHVLIETWETIREGNPHDHDYDDIVDDVTVQHEAMRDFIRFLYDDEEDDDDDE